MDTDQTSTGPIPVQAEAADVAASRSGALNLVATALVVGAMTLMLTDAADWLPLVQAVAIGGATLGLLGVLTRQAHSWSGWLALVIGLLVTISANVAY